MNKKRRRLQSKHHEQLTREQEYIVWPSLKAKLLTYMARASNNIASDVSNRIEVQVVFIISIVSKLSYCTVII